MSSHNEGAHVARQHSGSAGYSTLSFRSLWLRLHDRWREPLANARYFVRLEDSEYRGTADDQGWVNIGLQRWGDQCTVHWSEAMEDDQVPEDEDGFQYQKTVYALIDDGDREEATRRRLHNIGLGYESGDQRKRGICVRHFKDHYGSSEGPVSDELDQATYDELKRRHDHADLSYPD